MQLSFRYNLNQLHHQHGVTMIEAMISILLFAVGALGLVALQYSSMVGAGDNQQRTVAIWKAQEFANRIRSNPTQTATYITQVGNATLATIGDGDAADRTIITCGNGVYGTPVKICSDYIQTSAITVTNGVECTDAEKVDFDIWEVFCEPSTGAAITATTTGGVTTDAADGSAALTELELVLRQNTMAEDGNDDVAIYMSWLSREGEKVDGADTTATNISSNLCGRVTATGSPLAPTTTPRMTDIDSRLDVYCLRL